MTSNATINISALLSSADAIRAGLRPGIHKFPLDLEKLNDAQRATLALLSTRELMAEERDLNQATVVLPRFPFALPDLPGATIEVMPLLNALSHFTLYLDEMAVRIEEARVKAEATKARIEQQRKELEAAEKEAAAAALARAERLVAAAKELAATYESTGEEPTNTRRVYVDSPYGTLTVPASLEPSVSRIYIPEGHPLSGTLKGLHQFTVNLEERRKVAAAEAAKAARKAHLEAVVRLAQALFPTTKTCITRAILDDKIDLGEYFATLAQELARRLGTNGLTVVVDTMDSKGNVAEDRILTAEVPHDGRFSSELIPELELVRTRLEASLSSLVLGGHTIEVAWTPFVERQAEDDMSDCCGYQGVVATKMTCGSLPFDVRAFLP